MYTAVVALVFIVSCAVLILPLPLVTAYAPLTINSETQEESFTVKETYNYH